MEQGRGGMGSHKHGISGHPHRSAQYKYEQARMANRETEQKRKRRKRFPMFATIREAFAWMKPV